MKHQNLFWKLLFIALIVGGSVLIDLPQTSGSYFGKLNKTIELRKGLDLAGGSHLVYELDLSQVEAKDKNRSVSGVVQTIDRRINRLGVTEPTIQEGKIGDKRTVIVELPGISNGKEAIELIGKTAQLEFFEQPENPDEAKDSEIEGFISTGLTGAHLKRADVEFQNPTQVGSGRNSTISAEPVIKILFDDEGKKQFADITKRNLQKPVAIVIDKEIISAPTVQTEITEGEAIISGSFNIKSAKELAIALNSGALPVPIKLVSQQSIGATLGKDSIEKSLIGGIAGIFLVALFMILYYKFKGLIAAIALIIYTIIILAIFKFTPVTLTLAGIAGLILSIGAAVDANILIFERMKEELALGKQVRSALDDGFRRAWSSIRDSNISSIITSLILLWFGAGIVKGFAVTLLIGISVSMFSAITVSQTLLKLLLKSKVKENR